MSVLSKGFEQIAVSGQTNIITDRIGDTLNIVPGANTLITTTPGTKTLTIGHKLTNQVVVNSVNDFVNDGTKISLQTGVNYILNTVIQTSMYIELNGSCSLTSVNIGTAAFVYLGAGAAIRGTTFGTVLFDKLIIQAPNGSFFDTDGPGSLFAISTIFANCLSGGIIRNSTCTLFFAQLALLGDAVQCLDRTSLTRRTQFSLSHTVTTGKNNAVTLIYVTGNINLIGLQDSGITIGTNEYGLYLDPSLATNNTNVQIATLNATIVDPTRFFAPGSLTNTYVRSSLSGVLGATNSTSCIQASFQGRTDGTAITVVNTPVILNTQFIGSQGERIAMRDRFTVAGSILTSTYPDGTTAFLSGVANGDRVQVKTVGTLPSPLVNDTDYIVTNVSGNTFRLSTDGITPITLTTTGSGTFYFDHFTGTNANSMFVNKGININQIVVSGNFSLRRQTGTANVSVRAVLFKVSTTLVETRYINASLVNVDNVLVSTSVLNALVSLAPGEGVRMYLENTTSNVPLVATDGALVLSVSK